MAADAVPEIIPAVAVVATVFSEVTTTAVFGLLSYCSYSVVTTIMTVIVTVAATMDATVSLAATTIAANGLSGSF